MRKFGGLDFKGEKKKGEKRKQESRWSRRGFEKLAALTRDGGGRGSENGKPH